MRILIAAVLLGTTSSWAGAAGLDQDPWYVGAFAGLGIANMTNSVVVNGREQGEYPTNGITDGTLLGLVAGYHTTAFASGLYAGIDIRGAWDIGRSCFNVNCGSERHSGALLQQVGEVGLQWHAMVFAARLGVAERQNNLCVFDLPAMTRDCGSGFAIGPDVGAAFKVFADRHWDVFVTGDHIWDDYSASTPTYTVPFGFRNTAWVKGETVFTLGVAFH